MRFLPFAMVTYAAICAARQAGPWLLPNFAQRLEAHTLAVISVLEAAQTALANSAGRLALSGIQTAKIGELALALYCDAAQADTREPLITKDDSNELIVFRQRLEPGHAAEGRYWLASAWRGSGIKDLLSHVTVIGARARASVRAGKYVFTRTPNSRKGEGEAN